MMLPSPRKTICPVHPLAQVRYEDFQIARLDPCLRRRFRGLPGLPPPPSAPRRASTSCATSMERGAAKAPSRPIGGSPEFVSCRISYAMAAADVINQVIACAGTDYKLEASSQVTCNGNLLEGWSRSGPGIRPARSAAPSAAISCSSRPTARASPGISRSRSGRKRPSGGHHPGRSRERAANPVAAPIRAYALTPSPPPQQDRRERHRCAARVEVLFTRFAAFDFQSLPSTLSLLPASSPGGLAASECPRPPGGCGRGEGTVCAVPSSIAAAARADLPASEKSHGSAYSAEIYLETDMRIALSSAFSVWLYRASRPPPEPAQPAAPAAPPRRRRTSAWRW